MQIEILIGRIEGFISSVGFRSGDVTFLFRGPGGSAGLAFSPKEEREKGARALRELCAKLEQAGVEVVGMEKLDLPEYLPE